MADSIENQVTQEPVIAPDAAATELAQQMAISLNINNPAALASQSAVAEPTAEEGTIDTVVVETPIVGFDTFKEKFGYQTPEEAFAEIESLRALKNNPPTPEYQFENEESKKAFEAWVKGDKKTVFQILKQQQELEDLVTAEVTADTAAQIVKMGMSLKYKDLTPAEINYKFNKQFGLPAKPVQGEMEEQPEYDQRVAAWQSQVDDRQMELMIEAKLARPELENSKTKLVFPEIESPVDENYEHYLKLMADSERIDAEIKEAYKKFTPDSVAFKLNFNDEPNKIQFDFDYKPDAATFSQAAEIASDQTKFWNLFMNSDGTPNRIKFLRTVMYALNEQGIITESMKQTKNATLKSMLPDNSQGGGLVRQLPLTQEPNELDQWMQRAGVTRK